MSKVYSTRQVADFIGTDTWRVQRLFEDGTLDEPQRFAGKRVIPASMVPQVIDAMRLRGWLPDGGNVHA